MLNYLYAAYEKIAPQDLQNVDKEMKKEFGPHLPIENLLIKSNMQKILHKPQEYHMPKNSFSIQRIILVSSVTFFMIRAEIGGNSTLEIKHGQTSKQCSLKPIKISEILQW